MPSASRVEQDYKKIVAALKKAGFKETEATKSKIFTLVYLSDTAKGYISIRHDYETDRSTVIAEFFGKTDTQLNGLGGEMHLVDFTPRKKNIKVYNGMNYGKCKEQFVMLGRFMLQATAIYKEMSEF